MKQVLISLHLQAKQFQGRPAELSWWLAANLPLQHETRQALLDAPCTAARLRLQLDLMRRQQALHCCSCRTQVTAVSRRAGINSVTGVTVHSSGIFASCHDALTSRKWIDMGDESSQRAEVRQEGVCA